MAISPLAQTLQAVQFAISMAVSVADSLILLAAGVLVARGYLRTRSRLVGLLSLVLILWGQPIALVVTGLTWLIWMRSSLITQGVGSLISFMSVATFWLQTLLTLAGYILLCIVALQLDRTGVRLFLTRTRRSLARLSLRWRAFAHKWLP